MDFLVGALLTISINPFCVEKDESLQYICKPIINIFPLFLSLISRLNARQFHFLIFAPYFMAMVWAGRQQSTVGNVTIARNGLCSVARPWEW